MPMVVWYGVIMQVDSLSDVTRQWLSRWIVDFVGFWRHWSLQGRYSWRAGRIHSSAVPVQNVINLEPSVTSPIGLWEFRWMIGPEQIPFFDENFVSLAVSKLLVFHTNFPQQNAGSNRYQSFSSSPVWWGTQNSSMCINLHFKTENKICIGSWTLLFWLVWRQMRAWSMLNIICKSREEHPLL